MTFYQLRIVHGNGRITTTEVFITEQEARAKVAATPTATRATISAPGEYKTIKHTYDGQQWHEQHAEVTPAGLNYLLPGVEPIHTTTQGEGQARLL